MNEIIFLIEEAGEGGSTARALGESIFTEADNLDALRQQVREAMKRLPSKEKAEVSDCLAAFADIEASAIAGRTRLALADQMVATKNPEEADRLENEILAGFYGR